VLLVVVVVVAVVVVRYFCQSLAVVVFTFLSLCDYQSFFTKESYYYWLSMLSMPYAC